jgi:hypothetical protein
MANRQEYMENKVTHREYYGQYVTEDIKQMVVKRFSVEELKDALEYDEHLNNIPLRNWDILASIFTLYLNIFREQLKKNGDDYSLAGGVCILKEAAKQVVEENTTAEEKLNPTEGIDGYSCPNCHDQGGCVIKYERK